MQSVRIGALDRAGVKPGKLTHVSVLEDVDVVLGDHHVAFAPFFGAWAGLFRHLELALVRDKAFALPQNIGRHSRNAFF